MAWSKDNGRLAAEAANEALLQAQRAETSADNAEAIALENKTKWLPAVSTVALRDSTYPNPVNGDSVKVTGESRIYRYDSVSGWVVTDEYNATAIDGVTAQLADIAADDTFVNNHFKSHQTSYIGVQNEGYLSDKATRFYVLPKGKVLTGVGGALKIFGDDFSVDDLNYRDMGLYFSQDQNGINGYHNQGAFYINSKVNGEYLLKNPDIIFSFQDGVDIGGRFVRIINGTQTDSRAVMVIGEGEPIVALLDENMVAEVQGYLGFSNGRGFKALNAAGTSVSGAFYYTSADRWRMQGFNGVETYIADTLKVLQILAYSRFDHAVIHNTKTEITTTATTVSASGTNLIKFAQTSATTVTAITGGQHGHELTLYFANGNTTIQNTVGTGGINLAGAVNFTGTGLDTLTLTYIDDRWVEKCRSIN